MALLLVCGDDLSGRGLVVMGLGMVIYRKL